MAQTPQTNWLRKQHAKFDDLSDERREKATLIEALFQDYLKEPNPNEDRHLEPGQNKRGGN